MTANFSSTGYDLGYRWIVGDYDGDKWIGQAATLSVRRAQSVTFDIWLPVTKNAKPTKTIQFLFDGTPLRTVEAKRGENTYVEVTFPNPVVGRTTLEVVSDYPEPNDGDARELGFYCNALTVAGIENAAVDVSHATEDEEEVDPRAAYVMFPDYRASNPYQALIERQLSDLYEVTYASLDDVLERMVSSKAQRARTTVFHLHWTTSILSHAHNEIDADRRVVAYLTRIDAFLKLGGVLMWTVHNTLPHDRRYAQAEAKLCQGIADRAHRVHVHSEAALPETEAHFTIPADKLVVLAHPSYHGVYPNYVTREKARHTLGLDVDTPTFLFFGQLRPYKGISELIDAAKHLQARGRRFHLLIAGKPVHPFKPGTVVEMASGLDTVTVVERFIPDEELQLYFAAADVTVLPYRQILTSGTAMAALSFGSPIIAPDVPAMTDVVVNHETGWLFDPEAEDGLIRAMEEALLDHGRHAGMAKNALQLAGGRTWSNLALGLHAELKEATPGEITLEVNGTDRFVTPILPKAPATGTESTGIVVLTYQNLGDLERLLASLSASDTQDFRVYVVDNGSSNLRDYAFQALLSACPFRVEVYRSAENLGYAVGNNIGITLAQQAGHAFIWVLNPDTEVAPSAFRTLRDYATATPQAKVIGPKILKDFTSGTVWSAGGRVSFESGTRADHLYHGMDESAVPSAPYPADYLTGASLFCRPDLFDTVAPFPEHYFLYYEETDWCLAVRQSLGEVLHVCPSAVIAHKGAAQAGSLPSDSYFYYFIRNTLNFTRAFAPERLEQAEAHLQATFINGWLDEIKRRSPSRYGHFKLLTKTALADGRAGHTGQKTSFTVPALTETMAANATFSGSLSFGVNGRITAALSQSSNEGVPCSGSILVDHQPVKSLGYSADNPAQRAVEGDFAAGALLNDGLPHNVRLLAANGQTVAEHLYYVPHDFHYSGRINGLEEFALVGWVHNETNLDETVIVEAFEDERFLARGTANLSRPDPHSGGAGANGAFRLRIPADILDGTRRRITLKLAASGEILHSRDIVCRPPALAIPDGTISRKEDWLYANREAQFDPTERLTASYLDACNAAPYLPAAEDLPLVSVIMPAFNRARLIPEAIAAVAAQSYPKLELLIVDDGSKDETVAVAEAALAKAEGLDGRVIRLEANKGVSHARNVGLQNAQGSILTYLDTDNGWHPNYVSHMVSRMQAAQSETAYCAQTLHHVYEDGVGSISEPVMLRGGGFSLAQVENQNYIDLNAFAHSRRLYERFGGFNEDMTRLVDWELILRYCRAARPVYVRSLLSDYYMDRSDDQITRVEDHSRNLQIVRQTVDRGAPLPMQDAPRQVAVHLIVPISNPDRVAGLSSLLGGLSNVAGVTLLCVGRTTGAWWARSKSRLHPQCDAICIDAWTDAAAALSNLTPKGATHVLFATPNADLGALAMQRLCATADRFGQSTIAAATTLKPVDERLRRRHPFALGPLLFPTRPRTANAAAAEPSEHIFVAPYLDPDCFGMGATTFAALVPTLSKPERWEELCEQFVHGVREIGGRVVVDEQARVPVR